MPVDLLKIKQVYEDEKATLQNLEEKSKGLASARKQKELELASKEENIKKLTNQLYTLKTNKEYHAMMEQISGLRSDNSVLEEEILKIMDEQDKLLDETKKEKARLQEEEKHFQDENKKVEQRLKEIEIALSDLTAKRNQICPCVEKRILANYERLVSGRDGLALVSVANYACQGCFMNVTPQVVNEIKMHDRIVYCEACARMLYIEEDL